MSVHSFARPRVDKPSIGEPHAAAYPAQGGREERKKEIEANMRKINQEKGQPKSIETEMVEKKRWLT